MKNSRNGYMSSNVAGKSQNEMEGSFHGENHGISSKTQFSWVKPNLKKNIPIGPSHQHFYGIPTQKISRYDFMNPIFDGFSLGFSHGWHHLLFEIFVVT